MPDERMSHDLRVISDYVGIICDTYLRLNDEFSYLNSISLLLGFNPYFSATIDSYRSLLIFKDNSSTIERPGINIYCRTCS